MTYEIRDENGRLIKNEKRKFRPIDGKEISQESREKYKKAVKNQNWQKAHKIVFEVLTGEEIQ